MEDNTGQQFNKFSIPLTWGVITGVVSILIFTIYSMFLMSSMGFMGTTVIGVLSFIVVMVLLLVMSLQQRKAMGGFISFKEAFQGLFIAILIVVAISNIYTVIYTNWIDPQYFDKVKEMSVSMVSGLGDEEAADAVAEKMDEEFEKQKSFSRQMLGFAGSVILYSLFGFIIAAVVKRNKPEHLA